MAEEKRLLELVSSVEPKKNIFVTVACFAVFATKYLFNKHRQVAQLWQRDCTKLDTFSINVQHYSQSHTIEFGNFWS